MSNPILGGALLRRPDQGRIPRVGFGRSGKTAKWKAHPYFASGHRCSNAASGLFSTAPLGAALLALMLVSVMWVPARAQQQPPAQQSAAERKKDTATEPKTFGDELAQQTREATGTEKEAEEENANLKHSGPVRWLARRIGMSVHGTHLLSLMLNFAIVVGIVFWAARKTLPAIFRSRSQSIQQALEEARAASQDANRRLADIENRLRQLDVEIGRMQAAAEHEATAEEGRIQKAAEEDIRKVVQAAEQEIAAAAKQARRDLRTYTANLAVALARQQINVDSNTDQVLVRSFASKLSLQENDGGKDGR